MTTAQSPTFCGMQQGSSKRKVYSDPGLFKEGRKIPYEESEVTIIETGKRRTNEAWSQQKEVIKIREEINKIEKNKTIEKNQWNQELVL